MSLLDSFQVLTDLDSVEIVHINITNRNDYITLYIDYFREYDV